MQKNQRLVRCTKCGREGLAYEFKQDRDLFQNWFISGCADPKCDNTQTAAAASHRMIPGQEHPFVYADKEPPPASTLGKVLGDADEAS